MSQTPRDARLRRSAENATSASAQCTAATLLQAQSSGQRHRIAEAIHEDAIRDSPCLQRTRITHAVAVGLFTDILVERTIIDVAIVARDCCVDMNTA